LKKNQLCLPKSKNFLALLPAQNESSLLNGTYAQHSPEIGFHYELKLTDGLFELSELEGLKIKRCMLGCFVAENAYLKMTKNEERIEMDGVVSQLKSPEQTLQAPYKLMSDYNTVVLKLGAFNRTLCFYKTS